VLYKTKYVNKLIEYLSKINLAALNWSEKANTFNIKKDNANLYNIYKICPNPKLDKILDKIVIFRYKNCNVNIDKHIYTNVYEKSKQNTYYKILSATSKQFYLSNPCTYTL
jgi:ferredoxin-like protein FixX